MDLEQVKARIGELLQKLSLAIEFGTAIGASEEKLEILGDTEYFLQKLVAHIEVLETKKSLAVLEEELRETDLTLSGLRETLILWEPVDEEMISEVDSAQDSVRKILRKVKSGRSLKKKAPVFLIGAVLAVAAYRSRK